MCRATVGHFVRQSCFRPNSRRFARPRIVRHWLTKCAARAASLTFSATVPRGDLPMDVGTSGTSRGTDSPGIGAYFSAFLRRGGEGRCVGADDGVSGFQISKVKRRKRVFAAQPHAQDSMPVWFAYSRAGQGRRPPRDLGVRRRRARSPAGSFHRKDPERGRPISGWAASPRAERGRRPPRGSATAPNTPFALRAIQLLGC